MKRSTNTAPVSLSTSYLIGSPCIGISTTTLQSFGTSAPAGTRSRFIDVPPRLRLPPLRCPPRGRNSHLGTGAHPASVGNRVQHALRETPRLYRPMLRALTRVTLLM